VAGSSRRAGPHHAGLPALHTLDLGWCCGIDDGGAQHLSSLTALTRLGLAHTGVGDATLDMLAGRLLPLVELDVSGCR